MNIIEKKKNITVNPTSLECGDILYDIENYCKENGYHLLDNTYPDYHTTFSIFIKEFFKKDKIITEYLKKVEN